MFDSLLDSSSSHRVTSRHHAKLFHFFLMKKVSRCADKRKDKILINTLRILNSCVFEILSKILRTEINMIEINLNRRPLEPCLSQSFFLVETTPRCCAIFFVCTTAAAANKTDDDADKYSSGTL